MALGGMVLAGGAAAQEPPSTKPPALAVDDVQRPDGRKETRQSSLPIPAGGWNIHLECALGPDCTQDDQGRMHKFHGHPAVLEDSRMLFSAEYIELDEDAQEIGRASCKERV